jgi:hypothetical protein
MPAFPLQQTATALGISVPTLRRMKRKPGFPIARPGRRGRGNAELFDPDAIRAWQAQGDAAAALRAVAGRIPELLAKGAWDSLKHVEGRPKRDAAAVLAANWAITVDIVLEALGAPPATAVPELVERLEMLAE